MTKRTRYILAQAGFIFIVGSTLLNLAAYFFAPHGSWINLAVVAWNVFVLLMIDGAFPGLWKKENVK